MGLIKAFEKATGEKVNYKIVGRRARRYREKYGQRYGTLANSKELGWKAEVPIEETLANASKRQQALMKKMKKQQENIGKRSFPYFYN